MTPRWGDLPNTKLNYNGIEKTLYEWAQFAGLPWDLVRMRYTRGKRNYADLFYKRREYTQRELDTTYTNAKVYSVAKERRKNLLKRIEVLESKVEKMREVMLKIAERVDTDA